MLHYTSIIHYASLVRKRLINLFIRLAYFMANIQRQPLQRRRNFKELSAVTRTFARSLEKNCEGVPIYLVEDFKLATS